MTQYLAANRRTIDPLEHASDIVPKIGKDLLLTTKANERVNTMTIGWGALGAVWGRPAFTAYIRTGRFTHELLDVNDEFTINVPDAQTARAILGTAGSTSGRTMDKIAELGLTLVEPEVVSVPGIKELPLTLECRTTYRQDQVQAAIAEPYRTQFYPQDVDSSSCGANRDSHTMFIGEIVAAYVIE